MIKQMLATLTSLIILIMSTYCPAQKMGENKQHKIRITAGQKVTTATLHDNATARDFVQLLPMTMELTDYEVSEKIYELPKKLSTTGAPSGSDPGVGDITYYAPWGNIAIFYKDFRYSDGLCLYYKISCHGNYKSGISTVWKRPGRLVYRISSD